MKTEWLDQLPEFALGTLPEAEKAPLKAALADSPELRDELDRVTQAFADGAATLEPAVPSDRPRLSLLRTLDGPDRFAPFVPALERLFDLPAGELHSLLARIDDGPSWTPVLPNVQIIEFEPGQRAAPADAGLVRVAAGTAFPRHRHLGPEAQMVLEGTLIDGGAVYHPGDVLSYEGHTEHEYSAGPQRALVLIALHNGIKTL